MKKLTVFCSFAKGRTILIDDVAIVFDTEGYGAVSEKHRGKLKKYMRMRPGRIRFVEPAPPEVVVEAEQVAGHVVPEVVEAVVPEPEEVKDEPVPEEEPEVIPEEEEVTVDSTDETPPPPLKKKRGRKPKKTSTENE